MQPPSFPEPPLPSTASEPLDPDDIETAAGLVADADVLVVAAGAGIGVDSGLPDFRGAQGFWRAYPALGRLGVGFVEIANPRWFDTDPGLAWGFYGHRLALYRRTLPHDGFALLRRWGGDTLHGLRVFTSNVDGQFQRAGFGDDGIAECHGSLHHLQCSRPCSDAVWPADGFEPVVDADRCRLLNDPPACPRCGAVARPNMLMFGDGRWVDRRSALQQAGLDAWLDATGSRRIVVVEIGAGTAVPTVRRLSHALVVAHGARLVRINRDDATVPRSAGVGIAGSALAVLRRIDGAIAAARG